MNIAIDISPLKTGNFLSHRVRGTGQYLNSLKKSLEKYFPENKYEYFIRGEKLSKNIDVVHYPYFEPFFLTLPFGINKKAVVTVHDLTPMVFPSNFSSGIKGSIKWKIQKFNLKKAGLIITDSISSKNDIVKFAGIKENKIEVIYLAADENFRIIKDKSELKKVKEKFGLPDRFALYVGDVTWNKNLPRLLEAVNRANIPLVLVGKAIAEKEFDVSNPWNQDRIKIHQIISSSKNIKILGFVSSEELVALYNLATVFTMPSIYEGFGLPVLEAMSCGCPVITSRGGSLPEIAQEAAVYIDYSSVDNISEALKRVFNDKNIQKELSELGIKQSAKFSWEKTAKLTMQAYEKISKNARI